MFVLPSFRSGGAVTVLCALLVAGLLLAVRQPLGPTRLQQSDFIGRCSAAFGAEHFRIARQLLGWTQIDSGGYRIAPSAVQKRIAGYQVTFPARLQQWGQQYVLSFDCVLVGNTLRFALDSRKPTAKVLR